MSDKTKIMILDDEEGIVEIFKKIYTYKGYEVSTARTGEEAIEVYKSEKPDICILDIFLVDSQIDGVQVLEQIKQINDNAICIMITRVTDEEKISRARELGAKHYLVKPIDTSELTEYIEEAKRDIAGGK